MNIFQRKEYAYKYLVKNVKIGCRIKNHWILEPFKITTSVVTGTVYLVSNNLPTIILWSDFATVSIKHCLKIIKI